MLEYDFAYADDFNNFGLARVKKSSYECDPKWNFLKTDGTFLSSYDFYHADEFFENGISLIEKKCEVYNDEAYNYLRIDGTWLSPNEDFKKAYPFYSNRVEEVVRNKDSLFQEYIGYDGDFYYKCMDGTYTKDSLIFLESLRENFPLMYCIARNSREF